MICETWAITPNVGTLLENLIQSHKSADFIFEIVALHLLVKVLVAGKQPFGKVPLGG